MGIEEEADRTLFIRNLDARVTEELLFELFLQAGPLIKTKIPKDVDGKQKTFGFAVYKHEVSVPYAMQLLNGTSLFGRSIHVQFRSGSSHSNSTGNLSPTSTPDPHGLSLQKHAMMNNMMCQQLDDDFSKQRHPPAGGRGNFRQYDSAPYRPYSSQADSCRRNQRYPDDTGHHQQHRNNYNQEQNTWRGGNRHGGSRHHDDRGGNRGYQDSRWRRY
ncbi:RNA-binding protein 7 isoform X2 [Dunckerocampus dactyliophorus]|uniref:RNA-binding protein 7 isoform X2 n=1 Tax=Dunckerocampus dactyliophorus TaxID=161453 RepID=UPI0024053678|nr:RNA-binding protein 7 isoform X2 [Dunckerocampus dactyliophorus]